LEKKKGAELFPPTTADFKDGEANEVKAVVFLNKPAYCFRPSQAFSRLVRRPSGLEDVRLAWGTKITCNTLENIGQSILHQGLYDLVVSEAVCRLLPLGGTAIDVGANIGHMTGLMAKRAGSTGRVISFEPSSRIRKTLNHNVARWGADPRFARISIRACAASDRQETCRLYYPSSIFSSNEGTASLEESWGGNSASESEDVDTTTLDSALSDETENIHLLKIDVEGHELAVLNGAFQLLARKRFVHIIFEDSAQYRSPVHELLESCGYTLYRLARSFVRIKAIDPCDRSSYPVDVMSNFLATIEPQTVAHAFSQWGWRALRS
jgi:FkbM family methyltransferase